MFAFRFVAIGPFLAELLQIPYLTLKNLDQGHDENRPKSNQVIYMSGPTIVPKMKEIQKVVQKFKVKVMAKVKPDGHIWALEFNQYVCFSFRGNRTTFGWDIGNSIFDLENSRSKSWPRSNLMVTFGALELNRYVCFSFRGNRTIFGWDIANSIFDLENSRSRSWPMSNPMVTFEP